MYPQNKSKCQNLISEFCSHRFGRGGKQWQTTPKNLPRMQRTRATPGDWLSSGLCPTRPKGWIPIIIIIINPRCACSLFQSFPHVENLSVIFPWGNSVDILTRLQSGAMDKSWFVSWPEQGTFFQLWTPHIFLYSVSAGAPSSWTKPLWSDDRPRTCSAGVKEEFFQYR